MCIFFLCNLATILEFMQRNFYKSSSNIIDTDYYKKKMDAYERVFDAVIDDFNGSMFGPYANSVTNAAFQQNLITFGWKYFELNNLNELFSMMYKQKRDENVISEVQLTDPHLATNLSLRLDGFESRQQA